MEIEVFPWQTYSGRTVGSVPLFMVRLTWDSPPSMHELPFLTLVELRELADALIQHELELQEREHQEGKA